jgi:Arc/MetJ-type ribon-helix-helix transcriptional regulator
MKSNTKSSITLPPKELAMVNELMKKLKAKSKVEVIRKGLQLLKKTTDRNEIDEQYRQALLLIRGDSPELKELDALSNEGLPDEDFSKW